VHGVEWFVRTQDGRTLAVEDAETLRENHIRQVHAWLADRL
jgi:hypothetical protein